MSICSDFDPSAINPIYENSLRFCDLHNRLRYRTIIDGELSRPKIIKGRPFLLDLKPGHPEWMVKTITLNSAPEKKFKSETFLADEGIVRYYTGVWNGRFSIKDCPTEIKRYQEWLNNDDDNLNAAQKKI